MPDEHTRAVSTSSRHTSPPQRSRHDHRKYYHSYDHMRLSQPNDTTSTEHRADSKPSGYMNGWREAHADRKIGDDLSLTSDRPSSYRQVDGYHERERRREDHESGPSGEGDYERDRLRRDESQRDRPGRDESDRDRSGRDEHDRGRSGRNGHEQNWSGRSHHERNRSRSEDGDRDRRQRASQDRNDTQRGEVGERLVKNEPKESDEARWRKTTIDEQGPQKGVRALRDTVDMPAPDERTSMHAGTSLGTTLTTPNRLLMTEEEKDVKPSTVTLERTSERPAFEVKQEELPTRIRSRARPKGPDSTAQLIDHLPRADEAAYKTFERMEASSYGKLGKSRIQDQGIQCECRYRPGKDDIDSACSDSAGCINRLTQIECLESECNCHSHCQNQRFQKREYATVEIVQTEKKGFGLRAGAPLLPDQFIYEYLGEVIGQEAFYKRMQKYKDEGIRHFYFMMLQREEYVDATKKGGVGRFLNHSCNPNCYVAKWQVGKHFRMGIFAKRDILQGEELTFNYNVDRYGNDAQECFCGEPNCQGTIGGKTQTDIGGMDDLFIDALGIRDEVEAQEARGTKKKKSLHLDKDFNPLLRPMQDEDVAQVMTAIRQATSNRRILSKLLSRIHMTDQVDVQKLAVRLHGFVLMSSVLDEWKDDKEIVVLALGSLARWPLIARNKVVDSGIDQQVKALAEDHNVEIVELASGLLNAWEALEISYRIARRDDDDDDTEALAASVWDSVPGADLYDDPGAGSLENARAPNAVSEQLSRIVPLGTAAPAVPSSGPTQLSSLRFDGESRSSSLSLLNATLARLQQKSPSTPNPTTPAKKSLEEIIREATEKAEKDRQLALEAAEAAKKKEADEKARKAAGGSSRKHARSEGGSSHRKDKEKRRRAEKAAASSASTPLDAAGQDRRLEKLMGEVVVLCMSKYKEHFDRDSFKKYAKELTSVLCAKEKKKAWPPADGRIPTFSSEKRSKIKAFAKEYIKKLIDRRRRKASAVSKGAAEDSRSRKVFKEDDNGLDGSPVAPASKNQSTHNSAGQSPTLDGEAYTNGGDESTMKDDDDMDMEESDGGGSSSASEVGLDEPVEIEEKIVEPSEETIMEATKHS